MATQSKVEEHDSLATLERFGREDIAHYCADTSTVAIAILALQGDGRYRWSAGVVKPSEFDAFSDRFDAAIRAEFGSRRT